jgi:hypothetical protein
MAHAKCVHSPKLITEPLMCIVSVVALVVVDPGSLSQTLDAPFDQNTRTITLTLCNRSGTVLAWMANTNAPQRLTVLPA